MGGESTKGHTSVFLSLQMNWTKGDEEEYWNSSKFKAFTFDDEDDELSQVGFCEHLLKVSLSPLEVCSASKIPSPCIVGNLAFGQVSVRLRNALGQVFKKMFMEKSPQKRTRRTVKTNSLSLYS